jgi:glycosyltransferase involved in cell wall biosynthesis
VPRSDPPIWSGCLKVLHVIESLGRGGAEQLLVTLLPELARQGCAVAVAVRGGAMDLAPALAEAGVAVRRLPPRHRWSLLADARDIAAAAAAEQADVIHAHLYFPAVCTALVRLLRLHAAATCVTFHNLAYVGANRPGPGLWLRRALAAFVYPRGIDICLGVSAAVARHYETALRLRRVEVLHNAVDLREVVDIVAAPAPGDRLHLVLPGRLVAEKGHLDLLAALALLGDRADDLSVTFAGDGPCRPAIEEALRRLGMAERIVITGALPHAEMLRVIGSADLVVVPSRYEGFGLTALEAMALGRPVLASTAGGLPEVVGPAGVLVPPADPPALAEALGELLDDPDRRARLAEAGRRRAAAEFALQVVASRLLSIYRGLVPAEAARSAAA